MIKTFKHKGLAEFFATGKSQKVNPDLRKRVALRLAVLNAAKDVRELAVDGWMLHQHQPFKDNRWSYNLGQPWRITFIWKGNNAYDVDLEQYH